MSDTRLIIAGNFIDGSGDAMRRHVFLAVKDGIITDIGSAADLPDYTRLTAMPPQFSVIDDFSHCVILPALVDCSVSLSQSPATNRAAAEADPTAMAVLLERQIGYCRAHGVLGVVDIEPSGQPGCSRQRTPNFIDIRTADRLYLNDRHHAADTDGDFIKIAYSGNIEEEGGNSPRLNHADLHRIIQHRKGKKVVVTANGRQRVAEALAAGCDAIEQGYDMGAENIREMAKRKTLWIPSVLRAKNALDNAASSGDVCCRFSLRYAAPGKSIPGAEDFWQKKLDGQLAQLRLARKLMVTTAVGTGAGSVGILHGESVSEEIKLFIKSGYSLEEAIRCASENGARFFNMENIGALKIGRPATFLLTRGTTKQLPRKLSYLEGMYINGITNDENNNYRV